MQPFAADVAHHVEQLFFPCWLTIVSIILECIILRRIARHEPFARLLVQAIIANAISALITPSILFGFDYLFSNFVGVAVQRICWYTCIPFTHYLVKCFVSPAWFMLVATISDTVIEAPILWFFFNRKEKMVNTAQLWWYVLLANILTNGIAVLVVVKYLK